MPLGIIKNEDSACTLDLLSRISVDLSKLRGPWELKRDASISALEVCLAFSSVEIYHQ